MVTVLTGCGGFKYVLKLLISRWHPQMIAFALQKLTQGMLYIVALNWSLFPFLASTFCSFTHIHFCRSLKCLDWTTCPYPLLFGTGYMWVPGMFLNQLIRVWQIPFGPLQKCLWRRHLSWCWWNEHILWRQKNCRFNCLSLLVVCYLYICLGFRLATSQNRLLSLPSPIVLSFITFFFVH